MKDNNKNIDQLFEHFSDHELPYNPKAWEKMEARLDKELPIHSSSSKRFWPHVVGLGLIASLVIGYFITPFQELETQTHSFNNISETKDHHSIIDPNTPSENPVEDWMMATLNDEAEEFFEDSDKIITQKFKTPKNTQVVDKKEAQLIKTIEQLNDHQHTLDHQIEKINKASLSLNQIPQETIVIDEPIKVIKGTLPNRINEPIKLDDIQVGDQVFAKDAITNIIYEKNIDTLSVYRLAENNIHTMDTISIILTQRNKFKPLPVLQQIEVLEFLKQTKSNEVASLKTNLSNYQSKLVLNNSNLSVQSQQNNYFKHWFNNYFNENKPQYAYAYFGGSSLINKYLYSGLHIGAGIGYILSSNWNLNMDLKYTRQFLGQLAFKDIQSDFDIEKHYTGQNWEYEGLGNEEIQSYNVNHIQDFQLSSYLSYNSENGFSFLLGVMAKARLPLNYTHQIENNQFEISQVSSNGELYENQSFKLDPSKDFKASFSLGYMVGLQYDVNKQWSVQAKMNQSLLHSINSNFEYLKKMANAPTLEISLGYYFGRKDKIIYIMDYNK